MVDQIIRPADLPTERTNPVSTEFTVTDNGTTVAKVTLENAVLAGRPTASQAEAEAGVNPIKAMTPLTTKQAILSQGNSLFASAAQGALADTAIQSVVQGTNIVVDNTDPRNPIVSTTGGAIPDGDKGDVTVSGGGSNWAINTGVVTNGILSDMSGNTFKARGAGAGDPQDLTSAQALTLLKAAGAYAKDNIVGSVSDVDGVPAGAIIERGSNANGQYTKFADGTLICYRLNASGTVNFDNADAGTNMRRSGTITWTFPAAFASLSGALGASRMSSGKFGTWVGGTVNESAANTGFILVSSLETANGASYAMGQFAIGTWK